MIIETTKVLINLSSLSLYLRFEIPARYDFVVLP